MVRSLLVFQGGGPTAVINATLAGIADEARGSFGQLFGLNHSFESTNEPDLIDLKNLLKPKSGIYSLDQLAATPGAILGSSRQKVQEKDLERVLKLMRINRVDAMIGIGGNGTMAALELMAEYADANGQDLQIIGAPKTVDNDLPGVHVAPGYGSAARFVAMCVRDFDYDFRAMTTFDDVTILETMGRNTGWIAAASVLLKDNNSAPHIVLIPERPVNEEAFLIDVLRLHAEHGRVFVIVNEMLKTEDGSLLGESFQKGPVDSLGRTMYSLSLGTGNYLANKIWSELKLQTRCLRPGSLGRSMSFCVSEPDRLLARRTGRAAVSSIINQHKNRHMITINSALEFAEQPLSNSVGSCEIPEQYLDEGPIGLSDKFYSYARPTIGVVEPLFELLNE